MAVKNKPIKKGAAPEPENPRAEPGCFLVRGKEWFDEHGNMVIDEYGNVVDADYLVEPLNQIFQPGDFLYDESAYRQNGNLRAGANPLYELRWCPVAPISKKPRKR